MERVKSLEHLKKVCLNRDRECFIRLMGGLRSSKSVYFSGTEFEIFHSVDGSTEVLTPRSLMKTNIGEALKEGALFIG